SGVRAGLGLLRNVGRGGLGRLGRIGPRRQLLLDPGLLAGELAQVVELRSPHVAAPFHLDRGDEWRIELERPLHALSRRDLAHDERAVQPAIAPRDHDAFVDLHAPARALDHVHRDSDGVAGRELRNRLAEPGDLFLLELRDQIHVLCSDGIVAGACGYGQTGRSNEIAALPLCRAPPEDAVASLTPKAVLPKASPLV